MWEHQAVYIKQSHENVEQINGWDRQAKLNKWIQEKFRQALITVHQQLSWKSGIATATTIVEENKPSNSFKN